MKTIKTADGTRYYRDPLQGWVPLVDGETSVLGKDGGTYIFSAADNKFLPQTTLFDRLKKSTNDALGAVADEMAQTGLLSEETNFEAQQGIVPTRKTVDSPEYRASSQKAQEGLGAQLGQMAKNPIDYTLPLAVESAVPSVVGMAGAIGGGLAGTATMGPGPGTIAGSIAGAGLGSSAMNQGGKRQEVIQQLARQQGVDISNPDAYAAFVNSPMGDSTVGSVAQTQANLYAAPVAALDAISFGRAGMLAGPIEKALAEKAILKSAGKITQGIGEQMALSGLGEAGGQLAQTGEVYDPSAVGAEIGLELFGGAADMASMHQLMKSKPDAAQDTALEDKVATLNEADSTEDNDGLTAEDKLKAQKYLDAQGLGTNVSAAQLQKVAHILKQHLLKQYPDNEADSTEDNDDLTAEDKLKAQEYLDAQGLGTNVSAAQFQKVAHILKQRQLNDNVTTFLSSLEPVALPAPQGSAQVEAPEAAADRQQREAKLAFETQKKNKAILDSVVNHQELKDLRKSPTYRTADAETKTKLERLVAKKLAADIIYTKETPAQTDEIWAGTQEAPLVMTPEDRANMDALSEGLPEIQYQREMKRKDAQRLKGVMSVVNRLNSEERSAEKRRLLSEHKKTVSEIDKALCKKQQEIDAKLVELTRKTTLANPLSHTEEIQAAAKAHQLGFTEPVVPMRKSPLGVAQGPGLEAMWYRNPTTKETISSRDALGYTSTEAQSQSDEISQLQEELNALQMSKAELEQRLANTAPKSGSIPRVTETMDALAPKVKLRKMKKEKAAKVAKAPPANVAQTTEASPKQKKEKLPSRYTPEELAADPFRKYLEISQKRDAEEKLQASLDASKPTAFVKVAPVEQQAREASTALKELQAADEALTSDNTNLFTKGTVFRNGAKLSLYNRVFGDLPRIAGQIPVVAKYWKAIHTRQLLASQLQERLKQTLCEPLLADKEMAAMVSRAAAILDINKAKIPEFTPAMKEFTVTAERDYYGAFKKGDTVTLDRKGMDYLTSYAKEMQGIGRDHLDSTFDPFVSRMEKKLNLPDTSANSTDKTYLTIAQRIDSVLLAEKAGDIKLSENERNTLTNLGQAYAEGLTHLDKFYVPHIRNSVKAPWFARILDYNNPQRNKDGSIKMSGGKPVPTYVAVEQIPETLFGNKPSKRAMDDWRAQVQARIDEYHPGAVIEMPRDVTANNSLFLRGDQLDIYERMALASRWGSEQEKENFIDAINEEFGKRGFEKNFVWRKDIPGWFHKDNADNYLLGATGLYSHTAAQGIAKTKTRKALNDALAEVTEAAATGQVHRNVLKYVEDHLNYFNSPAQEFGAIRGFMYHFFIGLNPSSAFLQLFQTLHTSLPALIQMTAGTKTSVPKAFTLGLRRAIPLINWKDVTDPDIFVKQKPSGMTEAEWGVFQTLLDSLILKPIINEELSARRSGEAVLGADIRLPEYLQKAAGVAGPMLEKAANISSYAFGRAEAVNRLIVAFASYEVGKKAKTDPKTRAAMEQYFRGTAYDGMELTPTNVAEAMVRITQFDTTKVDKAAAFRGGPMAIAGQFLGFPFKMINFYLDLFNKGFFGQTPEGKRVLVNDKAAAKAFGAMALGLFMTSGFFGAVPFGWLGKDAAEKLIGYITGVVPDLEREIAETIVDITGSRTAAEVFLKGPTFTATGIDITKRTGINAFDTLSTNLGILDILGPTGGFINNILQARERVEQGHTTLAVASLMPGIVRNSLQAWYMDEYGLVTQKGNLVPVDLGTGGYLRKVIGYTPADITRTREFQRRIEGLSVKTSVLKEKYLDSMTTYRTKAALARKAGDNESAQKWMAKYYDTRKEVSEYNKRKSLPSDKLDVKEETIARRVKENLDIALKGKQPARRVANRLEGEAKGLAETFNPGFNR